jgi:iron(III) transport system ATP-binding protein
LLYYEDGLVDDEFQQASFSHCKGYSSMVRSEILRVEGVTKQFPSMAFPAVNQVTLTLSQGELLSLLGPSGCGKTTLLRLIAGFEQPQAGTIELDGQVVAGQGRWLPPERRNLGMVFQDYALFPHLTVAENVAFGLKQQNHRRITSDAKKIKHLVQEAIALVGLEGMDRRYPHQLSGGQQQRVALARALAPQPALILLDEPLSNLDVQVRLKLRQDVRNILKTSGTSAIFVTHDQEEALSISDRVAVIRQGTLEQIDTPEDLYQQPKTRFVAEFVTQANFLPAQLNGHCWETEIGQFALNSPSSIQNNSSSPIPHPSSLPASGELMIRQEDLLLEPDESGNAVIRDRQFLGREHRYCLLTASGRELHARTSVAKTLSVGTHVQLSVDSAALRFFATNNS